MKKLCKLSIIMPSLNVVDYIDECIQSALNQTLLDKEIICIDAGSTDGTWEKLVAYANNPKYMEEIVLLHCDVRSYGHQVNLGINIAVGEYVAILETDDYVEKNMYEQLYDIGISNDADFVKADYDTFMTFIENKRIFDKVSLFKNGKKQYGKIISPVRELYLYLNDHTIWKGIYKRDFLLNNNILLNETKGAAFQDIGFSLQVLSMAKRGIYIEESFYRYRLDRDESSINSVHGLKYAYWEFSRLLETEEIKRSLVYTDGIFACMALTFCFELVKALRVVGYDINSHFIKPYYTWFNDQLSYSLKNHLLDIDIYLHIPQLRFILENIDKFIFELKENDFVLKKNREDLISFTKGKRVIIFGFGAYGKEIIKYLYVHGIKIYGICDNNKQLWGCEEYGLPIYEPLSCVKKFPEYSYVIANKIYSEDIYEIGRASCRERESLR